MKPCLRMAQGNRGGGALDDYGASEDSFMTAALLFSSNNALETPKGVVVETALASNSAAAEGTGATVCQTTKEDGGIAISKAAQDFANCVTTVMKRPVSDDDVVDHNTGVLSGYDLTLQLEHMRTRRGPVGTSSRFRGVTRHRRTKRWEAHIWDNKKQVYLGGFDIESQAAKAHDIMALKCRGPNTVMNFNLNIYEHVAEAVEKISREDVVRILRRQSKDFAKLTGVVKKQVKRALTGNLKAAPDSVSFAAGPHGEDSPQQASTATVYVGHTLPRSPSGMYIPYSHQSQQGIMEMYTQGYGQYYSSPKVEDEESLLLLDPHPGVHDTDCRAFITYRSGGDYGYSSGEANHGAGPGPIAARMKNPEVVLEEMRRGALNPSQSQDVLQDNCRSYDVSMGGDFPQVVPYVPPAYGATGAGPQRGYWTDSPQYPALPLRTHSLPSVTALDLLGAHGVDTSHCNLRGSNQGVVRTPSLPTAYLGDFVAPPHLIRGDFLPDQGYSAAHQAREQQLYHRYSSLLTRTMSQGANAYLRCPPSTAGGWMGVQGGESSSGKAQLNPNYGESASRDGEIGHMSRVGAVLPYLGSKDLAAGGLGSSVPGAGEGASSLVFGSSSELVSLYPL